MDIQISWQVPGQQVGRYTCIRLYMSNCQHADLPLIQGLLYIYIYIVVYIKLSVWLAEMSKFATQRQ